MFLDKCGNNNCHFMKIENLDEWRSKQLLTESYIPASKISIGEWNFTIGKNYNLFERLNNFSLKLGEISKIFVGLQTSADTVFLFKDSEKSEGLITEVYSKELKRHVEIESHLLKNVIRSGNIGRFWAKPSALVLFPYKLIDNSFRLIDEKEMKSVYPNTLKYLECNKKLLTEREHGKFKNSGWYQLYPKNLDTWEQPKIMMPYMITRLSATYDEDNSYFVNVTTGGFGITATDQNYSMKFITGLLNSMLLNWFMKNVSTSFHGGYFAANKQFLVQLPIPEINFNNSADKLRYDQMITLVEQMLSLNRQIASSNLEQQKRVIQRQIDATDKQIDQLVYKLYGLTEEEIKTVESEN